MIITQIRQFRVKAETKEQGIALVVAGKGALISSQDVANIEPSDHITSAQPIAPTVSLQPGDIFSAIIRNVTGQSPCGPCITRIQTMNEWGWLKCWQNQKTISGWLVEEARRRGHLIDARSALGLFKAAYRELKSKRHK